MELTKRERLYWLAGALLMGALSQWCVNYGPCAAYLSGGTWG
jgi:hypothetical protein